MKITKKKKIITEMDSSMLGGDSSTGGAVMNSDSYAPGDNRVPKILGLFSRKEKKKTFEEDEEDEIDYSNDPELQKLFKRMDIARAMASPLSDLTDKDWDKIFDNVDKNNTNVFEETKKYYRKKFGETISDYNIDIYLQNYHALREESLDDNN